MSAGVFSAPGTRVTTALTWVPDRALRGVSAPTDGLAQALVSCARSLDVDIVWVPAAAPWATQAAEELAAAGMRPAWAVDGPLSRVAGAAGWAETLRASAASPSSLADSVARSMDGVLDDMAQGAAAGCDIVVLADDLAGLAGWLVSPDFALESLVPTYRLAAEAWKAASVFHSDGDIRALMPALGRAGFGGVHLASLTSDEVGSAARCAWSAGLVAFGGLSAHALDDGTYEQAAREARALCEMGAFVVCDDGGITVSAQLVALREALASARGESASDQR